jgi:diacylglycerol kinase (ATP)
MEVAVIANPTSGGGRGARLIPKVEALLSSLDVKYAMHICAGAEDPERLARSAAAEGAGIVAALGGDGQTGSVANGLMGSLAAMAVIPAGSGNDFAANGLGLNPKDPLAAARLLADPLSKKIDVVKISTRDRERYCVNVAGVGFDSEVNGLANRTKFPLGGTPKYIYSVFATLAKFKPARFAVSVDGAKVDTEAMMMAVGNSVSYGGGMRICPDARPDDGMLDMCILGKVSKFEFVRAFPRVFKGTHVTHPAVRMLRGSHIEVAANRSFDVYADGERVGPLPATFTVMPDALSVVVPAALVGAISG